MALLGQQQLVEDLQRAPRVADSLQWGHSTANRLLLLLRVKEAGLKSKSRLSPEAGACAYQTGSFPLSTWPTHPHPPVKFGQLAASLEP